MKVNKCTSTDIKIALAKKHNSFGSRDYFLTEVKSGSTWNAHNLRILDGLAIRKSWANPHLTGYEIKVSRSDFTGDAKFYTYLPLVHTFYMVTPKGLVHRDELPVEIGLMYYDPESKRLTVKKKPPPRSIEISKDILQYIIFSRLETDRIPFYSDKAEYWRDWLQDKKEKKELGYMVAGKLKETIRTMEEELKRIKRFENGDREQYQKLLDVMEKHGMPSYIYYPDKWLDEVLEKGYPPELDGIENLLEGAIAKINNIKSELSGNKGGEDIAS